MFLFSFLKLGFDFIAGRAIALFNMRMQIAAFIIDRWRVILPVAILCLTLLYVIALRTQVSHAKFELKTAQKALIAHVESDNELSKKREAENKAKIVLTKKTYEAREATYRAALNAMYSSQKGLKDEIAINKRDIANYTDGLRLSIQRETARVREFSEAAKLSSEGSTEYAVAKTLEGCKVDALNYNELINAWYEYCDIYSCEGYKPEGIK